MTTALERLKERAADSEGRYVGEAVQVKYQRPRYLRSGRLIPGRIEAMCYEYRTDTHEYLSQQEAELMLAGATWEEILQRRDIEAAGVFERARQGAQFQPLREL